MVELDVWRKLADRQKHKRNTEGEGNAKQTLGWGGRGLGEPATLYIGVKGIKSNYASSNSPLRKLGGVWVLREGLHVCLTLVSAVWSFSSRVSSVNMYKKKNKVLQQRGSRPLGLPARSG